MESGTWQVQQFNRVRAIQLKQFKRLKELKRNGAAWASRISDGGYISEITRKKDGAVIIKKEMLSVNEPLLFCIEQDFFVVWFHTVEDVVTNFLCWPIDKETAKKIRRKREFYVE